MGVTMNGQTREGHGVLCGVRSPRMSPGEMTLTLDSDNRRPLSCGEGWGTEERAEVALSALCWNEGPVHSRAGGDPI